MYTYILDTSATTPAYCLHMPRYIVICRQNLDILDSTRAMTNTENLLNAHIAQLHGAVSRRSSAL